MTDSVLCYLAMDHSRDITDIPIEVTHFKNMLSRCSFQMLCALHSDLDELWTDTPSRAYVNRLYWPTYGRAAVVIDGKEVTIEPGYLYLIPTNCMLELKAQEKFGKYWCHFSAPTFNGFDLLEMIETPIRLTPENPERIDKFFKLLAQSGGQEVSGWMNIQRIVWLQQLLCPFLKEAGKIPESERRQQLRPALQFIQSNIQEDIKLENLANSVNLSPTHFSRLFRNEFQSSPIQYLIIKRIQLAQSMLCLSTKSVKEIGQLCGFNDSNHFLKIFRKVTTRTPLQFRKAFQNKGSPSEILRLNLSGEHRDVNPPGTDHHNAHMKRGWLRGDFDWRYCNLHFNVLSACFFRAMDLNWQKKEQTLRHNMLLMPANGIGYIKVNHIDRSIKAGEMHLIPCGAHLTIQGGYDLDLHQCSFSFLDPEGNDLFESIHAPDSLPPESFNTALAAFKNLVRSFEDRNDAWRLTERAALLLQLLMPFLKSAEEHPCDHNTFMPALLYIRDHLDQPILLEDLANIMNQSPEHFARSFRKALKRPPMHYVLEQRIKQSKQLLIRTNLSAQDIGLQCGFNTPSHFAKTFKKATGMPPGQYRKSTQGH